MFKRNLLNLKQLGKKRFIVLSGSLLLGVGWLLSPLTWWNDWLINLPLAWIVSSLLFPNHQGFFGYCFVAIYWLTNLIGMLMMYFGWRMVCVNKRFSKRDLIISFVFSVAYTVLILILIKIRMLKPL